MSTKEEITKAIGAHGMWKSRLRSAIDSGKSEWQPDSVAKDNLCDFGKWIHSLKATPAEAPRAAKVKDLHAKFHVEASRVLKLAQTGQKAAASQAIAPGSPFDKLTGELTTELMNWSKAA